MNAQKPAVYWVEKYRMQPHPEGGYFAETYRAAEQIPQAALPERFKGSRAFSTAIYFLLEGHHFSVLHRIQADELWHFYAGDPLKYSSFIPKAVSWKSSGWGRIPRWAKCFRL